MKVAIYCRVSTEGQEQEGTSLQTQAEACLKYCQSKSYEVAFKFTEAYSGLCLERPRLVRHIRNSEVSLAVYAGEVGLSGKGCGHAQPP